MVKYYDVREDLEAYPQAWCYLIWSKRGPGKTYSTLRYMIEEKKMFIFMKRTIEDVNLLCTRMSEKIEGLQASSEKDLSPFAPLNRDFGWNIKPFLISAKGLAGFWEAIEDPETGKEHPTGPMLGYIVANNATTKFKGFSMDADYLIFDEFIPKPWDRVNRKEGDSVLDFYETVSRDRVKRGRPELKLICLANATMLNNPMFNTLNVVDTAANMDICSRWIEYQEYRGIFLHYIDYSFDQDAEQEKTGIQRAMEGTPWAAMAYGGHFGYSDYHLVGKQSLKGFKPVCSVSYKNYIYYIYMKEGAFYMTYSKHNKDETYNLNQETEQRRFFRERCIDLRQAACDGCMYFETFQMYDVIVNYKEYFSLKG